MGTAGNTFSEKTFRTEYEHTATCVATVESRSWE